MGAIPILAMCDRHDYLGRPRKPRLVGGRSAVSSIVSVARRCVAVPRFRHSDGRVHIESRDLPIRCWRHRRAGATRSEVRNVALKVILVYLHRSTIHQPNIPRVPSERRRASERSFKRQCSLPRSRRRDVSRDSVGVPSRRVQGPLDPERWNGRCCSTDSKII